jgi:hypothetical protein
MGTAFWGGLIDWLRSSLVSQGMVHEDDLELITLTDDPVEAVEFIKAWADGVDG